MSRNLIYILIVGQLAIDLAFLVYIWVTQSWQNQVTEILQTLLESGV